ncbi:MAG TPA: hypothetical protein VNU01_12035 [Egibacteraceae bacterium]|nr:hypothetical protein [Egibacteraceae bacterium]
MTSRCAICGKEVAQSGPARQWRHLNEFYAKADHPADPASKTYVAPKAAPPPPAKKAEEPKPKRDGNKPKSLAELRRRLQQGTAEAQPDDSLARRRRVAALDAGDTGPTDEELAARRLRLMRLQAAAEEEKRR